MTPTELLISRLINLGMKEFTSREICTPEFNMDSNKLRSAFDPIIKKKAVDVLRQDIEGCRVVNYYRVNKYRLRQFMDSRRNFKSKSTPIAHTDIWFSVWPEFFIPPNLSGKKRVFKTDVD